MYARAPLLKMILSLLEAHDDRFLECNCKEKSYGLGRAGGFLRSKTYIRTGLFFTPAISHYDAGLPFILPPLSRL